MMLALYSYWRSSAAYRARIALNLKRLDWSYQPISLLRDGGEHNTEAFAALNPQQLLPVLEADGATLTQSLAIMEYLEETHPEPAFLPTDPHGRARVRALAYAVACDIHPLNNSRVLADLGERFGADQDAKAVWRRHWINTSFGPLETMLSAPETGRFCHGDSPGLADICLIPQIYNARRSQVDMSAYPILSRIETACLALEAFDKARPEIQPDATA